MLTAEQVRYRLDSFYDQETIDFFFNLEIELKTTKNYYVSRNIHSFEEPVKIFIIKKLKSLGYDIQYNLSDNSINICF